MNLPDQSTDVANAEKKRAWRLHRRTIKWCWIAGLASIASLSTILLTGMRIDTPDAAIASISALFVSWLGVSIFVWRPKFRLLSLLVFCSIVAVLFGTVKAITGPPTNLRQFIGEVTRAGGRVVIARQKTDSAKGSMAVSPSFAVLEYLNSVRQIFNEYEILAITIPVHIVNEEFVARHFVDHDLLRKYGRSFAGTGRIPEGIDFALSLQGTDRDYPAIELLITTISCDAVNVEFSELTEKDADYFYSRYSPFNYRYISKEKAFDLSPEEFRRAVAGCPRQISVGSGIIKPLGSVFDESGRFTPDQLNADLREQTCNEKLLAAMDFSTLHLSLKLENCKLNDSAWYALGRLSNLEELTLVGCNPSEAQLLGLRNLKKLTRLDLAESTINENCLIELSKIGTLTSLQLSHVRYEETLRNFLRNNPDLLVVSIPNAFFDEPNAAEFARWMRPELAHKLGMSDVSNNESQLDYNKLPRFRFDGK